LQVLGRLDGVLVWGVFPVVSTGAAAVFLLACVAGELVGFVEVVDFGFDLAVVDFCGHFGDGSNLDLEVGWEAVEFEGVCVDGFSEEGSDVVGGEAEVLLGEDGDHAGDGVVEGDFRDGGLVAHSFLVVEVFEGFDEKDVLEEFVGGCVL
jgi:hypothetical protein